MKLTTVHRKLVAKEERIWLAFCKLDLNGDGRISRDEIKQVLATKQDADVLAMLKEADADGDGTIDYDEFMALWTKKASLSGPPKEAAPAGVAEGVSAGAGAGADAAPVVASAAPVVAAAAPVVAAAAPVVAAATPVVAAAAPVAAVAAGAS